MQKYLALLIALSVQAPSLIAKGLDDMKPTPPEEKQSADSAGAPPSEVETGVKDQPPTDAAKVAGNEAEVSAEKAAEAVAPGALSKKMADKLQLGVGFGLARIPKAKIGTFASQGAADISLAWKVFNSSTGARSALVSLRYLPIHSENRIEGESFKSIIEGYYLGAQYRHKILTERLFAFAALEVGYLLVYMETRDRYPVKSSSEANELAFAAGTGLDWLVLEKLFFGPRIYAGFGDYQITQFSLAATAHF